MQLNQPFTPTIIAADFKTLPEDFVVTECLDVDFSEQGEHLWVYIAKTNMNTAFVAKLLAEWAGIGVHDVGYSGLKDRHALTFQWFSLRIPHKQTPSLSIENFFDRLNDNESLQLLKSHWHHKKLNRGTHRYNHFKITLKNVKGNVQAIDEQLTAIKNIGIPNYFGSQRFGIDNNNIMQAQRFFEKILNSERPYKTNRKTHDKHAIYISTARSLMFNAILSHRVALRSWNQAIAGDVFNLDGTGSIFTSVIDEDIIHRVDTMDIHPTAVLYGAGEFRQTDVSASIQDSVLNDIDFAIFKAGLTKISIKPSYRPLRLVIKDLTWQWQSQSQLMLDFYLPCGAFATSVLDAICDTLHTKIAQDASLSRSSTYD